MSLQQWAENGWLRSHKTSAREISDLLAIVERDLKDAEQVRAIAFEIAILGRSGLDYASPEKKYTLRSIPDETFSGLQLICLMHAGFKRVAPDMDTGMDLEEPWHQALALFHASERDAD